MLFNKPWPNVGNNNHYREVVNDVDGDLFNFYEVLRSDGDALVRELELTPFSEQDHAESKRPFPMPLTNLERARRYFVNVNGSFANKVNGGWRRSISTRNESTTAHNKRARMAQVVDRFQSVSIACQDAIKIIEQWDSPQTFFYCDPPYPETEQGHYDGYTIEDFKALVSALHGCQGAWILSCYPQEGVEFCR